MSCITNTKKQSSNSRNPAISVTLEIIYTSDYCQGAAPPKDLVEKLATPKKLVNQRVYIFDKLNKEGNKTMVDTDREGKISMQLTSGIYYFFLREKVETTDVKLKSESCEQWLATPDASFEVKEQDTQLVSLKVHRECNPCLPLRR